MAHSWDEEEAARELLEELLGGVGRRVDPGGGAEPRHDFDLSFEGGRRIAVEVTQHISATDMAARSELEKRDWQVSGLHHNWEVRVISSCDVRELHRALGTHLMELESKKLASFFLTGDMFDASLPPGLMRPIGREALNRLMAADAVGAGAALFDLGVRRGFCCSGSQEEGTVTFTGSRWVGASGPSNVVRAANRHLADVGNQAKLRSASDHAERHLFVWLDSTMPSSSLPLASGFLPDVPPTMAREIDVVWVASAMDPPCIWRFDRVSGWSNWTSRGRKFR